MEVLKAFVETGLIMKRNDEDWSLEEVENVINIMPEYKKFSKKERMEFLVRAGVYNINNPNTPSLLLRDFYAPGSNSSSPRKVMEALYKEKNAKQKATKKTVAITRKPGESARMQTKAKAMQKKTKPATQVPRPPAARPASLPKGTMRKGQNGHTYKVAQRGQSCVWVRKCSSSPIRA